MTRAGKVAVARIVLSGRERLVAINPITDGFRLMTLRSAKEVREPSSVLDKLSVKISDDMLQMAQMIISQKAMTFVPEAFEDRYEEALLALVKSKISGGQPVIAKAPERGNVVNLMDALRRSIQEERRPPAASLGKAAPAAAGKAAPERATPNKASAKASAKKPAAVATAVEPPAKKRKSSAA
jgi:DNA end-binding protein Ku